MPLVRSLGTAKPNNAPYRTDSAAWMASPTPALPVPRSIASSPLTMIEIICRGTLVSAPIECAYHVATAANTTPDSTPPTAPRSNRTARGSS